MEDLKEIHSSYEQIMALMQPLTEKMLAVIDKTTDYHTAIVLSEVAEHHYKATAALRYCSAVMLESIDVPENWSTMSHEERADYFLEKAKKQQQQQQ